MQNTALNLSLGIKFYNIWQVTYTNVSNHSGGCGGKKIEMKQRLVTPTNLDDARPVSI